MPIREASQSRDAVTTSPGMIRLAAVIYVLVGTMLAIFLVVLASGVSYAKPTAGRVPSGALTVGNRLLSLLAPLSHVFSPCRRSHERGASVAPIGRFTAWQNLSTD